MPRWTGVTFRAFLTNCDRYTHTSSEINTILLQGSYVQTFVSIEEAVLRGLFNSFYPKFFQQAALNHCCWCSLKHRDLQRVLTGAKMLCYRRIRLVLHCKAVAVRTFPEGATSLTHIDCVAFGMATGDEVNHTCGRTSEVFLDKVGVICLVSKSFDIANNLTCLAAGDLTWESAVWSIFRRAVRICSRAGGQEVPQVPWALVGNKGQIEGVAQVWI